MKTEYNPSHNPDQASLQLRSRASSSSSSDDSKDDEDTIQEAEQAGLPDNNRRLTDTNLLGKMIEKRENQAKEQREEDAIANVVDKVKSQIMPQKNTKELEDRDVLSFIQKSVNGGKKENKLIKPKPKVVKKKVDSMIGDNSSFLIREMDKRLKRTINDKVAAMIKNDQRLKDLSIPKEEVYYKLAHKLVEMQEKHALYKGEATNEVFKKGKTLKEVSDDSRILILYLSNLILFSKKTDAVKTIDEYGKYFFDRNLTEANLRKLRGLALIRNKKENNFENATEAVKEFLHAKVIFLKHDCHHGAAIC